MPFADRLYITHVHKNAPADVYFPEIDSNTWEIIEKEDFPESKTITLPYTYIIYGRRDKV
jgi:dihydrofolate reductase